MARNWMTISRDAGRHALAGAEVERHAGPAPVLDLGLERDEGLGARALASRPAARPGSWLDRGGLGAHAAVLAAHRGLASTSPSAIGFSERSTLSFSSRSALASSEAGGSIATRQSELHHVVLDHVAQRAALVVVAARAGADRLGHRDLHVVDVRRVPDRLEEDVGEAQRQQVLHRLFAEVVIDAVDLIFLEDLGDRVVDLPIDDSRSWPSGFSITTRASRR